MKEIPETLKYIFINAATALKECAVDTGMTTTGCRRLDFKAKGSQPNVIHTFTAVEQNPNATGPVGEMAREGRMIVQIRDADEGVFLGFVDIEAKSFTSYEDAKVSYLASLDAPHAHELFTAEED